MCHCCLDFVLVDLAPPSPLSLCQAGVELPIVEQDGRTPRDAPASASLSTGIEGLCYYCQLKFKFLVSHMTCIQKTDQESQIHLPGHTWNQWLLGWAELLPPTPVLLHKLMMPWKLKGVRSCYCIKLEAEGLPASCSKTLKPNCTISTASIGSKEPWCQSLHYSALRGIKPFKIG